MGFSFYGCTVYFNKTFSAINSQCSATNICARNLISSLDIIGLCVSSYGYPFKGAQIKRAQSKGRNQTGACLKGRTSKGRMFKRATIKRAHV
jgi:hypothetical protein